MSNIVIIGSERSLIRFKYTVRILALHYASACEHHKEQKLIIRQAEVCPVKFF